MQYIAIWIWDLFATRCHQAPKRLQAMPRWLPQVFTRDEARRLLQTPSRYYPTGRRDLCLLKLMLNAGLRASEVLGLTRADLHPQNGKLVVRRGKGDKDRQLWINDDVLGLLRNWRGEAPPGRLC